MGIVNLKSGKGHSRHNHPDEEEVIYVVSGDGEPMKVTAGMCIHIPVGVYHSTVNTGW